jgi:subtilisin family serine protease
MLTAVRTGRRGRRLAGLVAMLASLPIAALLLATPANADTVRSTETWVLDALNVQPVWAAHIQGQGVTVAVIDSGVDGGVSDLVGAVRPGPNFSGVPTPPSNQFWGVHGTWMASLIAGHGNGPADSDGIIGIAPKSTVLSIRVITDQGDPHFTAYEHQQPTRGQEELANAITYAVSHRAGVISMSLGYNLQSSQVRAALQDAYDHDVVVVASAGNSGGQPTADGQSPYSFPANYPGVLGVAAVNQAGQVASFSSQNLSVQVSAPGSNVPAQGRNSTFWLVSGTSPACALTAGVAALIKSKYPRLTDTQVISAITTSTTPASRPGGGYNDAVGFGEVNAGAAVAAAGRIARATRDVSAVSPNSHFGGGLAGIPASPVKPRSIAVLALYCLLGAVGLALVAISISRLFAMRDSGSDRAGLAIAEGLSPGVPAGPPGRHAVARGHPEGYRDQWSDIDHHGPRYGPEYYPSQDDGGR